MSVVRKYLTEERQEFISLRELLEAIRESDGCTLQEAADFLAKCLCEARLQETGPNWCSLHPGKKMVRLMNQREILPLLDYVATTGEYYRDLADDIPF